MGQGNCYIYYKCCCILLLMSTMSGLLKSTVLSVILVMSAYKIMLADSSTGSGLYL